MKLSPKTRRNLSRILPFGFIWLVLSWIFLYTEYAASDRFAIMPDGAVKMETSIFIFGSFAIFLLGIFVGSVEVFLLNKMFAKKSFARKLVAKTILYLVFLFLAVLITYPTAASMEMKVSFLSQEVWVKFLQYMQSPTFLSTALQLGLSLFLSLFYFEIGDHMGQGILFNLFTGRYHKPKEEVRIFMFLDMKDSTSIAEKLGHVNYYNLLNEYYGCFTNPIVKNQGEIYQYIGDEIVISWSIASQDSQHNAIKCFFDMQEALKSRQPYFREKYGVSLDFRAGLHVGQVTVGEIGALKKEIIFTGDVLNTTSRIQEQCKKTGKSLLISSFLIDQLRFPLSYKLENLGGFQLRGKEEVIGLYGVIELRSKRDA